MKILKIAKNFSLPATQYGSQANAILGVRDTGKTYTAMKIAEQLLDARIPITVYDPVGVWKNIRIGNKGKKGYPVIVAGGEGTGADIILTEHNAVDIVRAAMKAGISIILDLFHKDLTKAAWIRIVQSTSHLLMYENQDYGLRHIFYEEANEFIPQNAMPQQKLVAASIEKIVRMGRNSSLGVTIINQRSQEIAKSVFELCVLVFMHKQVGKNSLKAVSAWLEAMGIKGGNEDMVHHLPALEQGQSFVMDSNNPTSDFKLIKTLPKNTFHPSPEFGVPPKMAKSKVNISAFVKKLNAELEKEKKKSEVTTVKGKVKVLPLKLTGDNEKMKKLATEINEGNAKLNIAFASEKENIKTIEKLKKENAEVWNQLMTAVSEINYLATDIKGIESVITKSITELSRVNTKPFKSKVKLPVRLDIKVPVAMKKSKLVSASYQALKEQATTPAIRMMQENKADVPDGYNSLTGTEKMIKGVAMYPEGISKSKLALLCGMTESGTFANYYGTLRSEGLLIFENGLFFPTPACTIKAEEFPGLAVITEQLLQVWYDMLGDGGITRILRVLVAHNYELVSKAQVAEEAEMTQSGTFANYYGTLRKKGLIEIKSGQMKLSDNFKL